VREPEEDIHKKSPTRFVAWDDTAWSIAGQSLWSTISTSFCQGLRTLGRDFPLRKKVHGTFMFRDVWQLRNPTTPKDVHTLMNIEHSAAYRTPQYHLHRFHFLLMLDSGAAPRFFVHPLSPIAMQKIPAAHRRAVEQRFPNFVEAVNAARLAGEVPVTSSLADFVSEDMASVYVCLWYAYSAGVDVTFVADPE